MVRDFLLDIFSPPARAVESCRFFPFLQMNSAKFDAFAFCQLVATHMSN